MKSSRRPKNLAEGEAYDALTADGCTVTKRGCPDFFVFKGDDFFLVECKKQGVRLKSEQVQVMKALLKRGVKCCLWRHGLGLEGLTLEHPFLNYEEPDEEPLLKSETEAPKQSFWPDDSDDNSEGQ